MEIAVFTFNPFQENTYLLYDDTGECIIIDPGCNNMAERKQLTDYIEIHQLKPVRLINTHCHIDHILGNAFVSETYNLGLEIHRGEEEVLRQGLLVSQMYGIPYHPSPNPSKYIEDRDVIDFGNTNLESILTPGHSPASLSFYHRESRQVIAGDVLFRESIGRTDLPGGDYNVLIKSIKNRLLVLGDDVRVFPGHGDLTTIGHERVKNPFLRT